MLYNFTIFVQTLKTMEVTTKPKKKVIKAEEKTYQVAVNLNEILGRVKNRGLSVDSLRSVLKLKARVKSLSMEFTDLVIAVMDKYDIKPSTDGVSYDYKDHPKVDQVRSDVKELESTVVKIEPTKFMTAKELQSSLPDESIDVIDYLSDILLKDN